MSRPGGRVMWPGEEDGRGLDTVHVPVIRCPYRDRSACIGDSDSEFVRAEVSGPGWILGRLFRRGLDPKPSSSPAQALPADRFEPPPGGDGPRCAIEVTVAG